MEKLAKLIYIGIIVAIAYFLLPYFVPFLAALVVAVLFEPVIGWLVKKTKLNRLFASGIVLTVFFVGMFTLLYLGISKLVKMTYTFVVHLPAEFNHLKNQDSRVREFYIHLPASTKTYINHSTDGIVAKVTSFLSKFATDFLSFMGHFPVYFIATIIFIIATYIFSIEMKHLKSNFLRYFEAGKSQKKIEIALEKLKSATVGFLQAQIILSLTTYILALVGLLVLKTDNYFTLAAMIMLADLLPILGAGCALVPWGIYLIATGNVYAGVGLIILFLVITITKRALESKLLAHSLGVNPLLMLISLYVGFELMGFLGMILFPTIIIVIKALEEARLIRIKLKI